MPRAFHALAMTGFILTLDPFHHLQHIKPKRAGQVTRSRRVDFRDELVDGQAAPLSNGAKFLPKGRLKRHAGAMPRDKNRALQVRSSLLGKALNQVDAPCLAVGSGGRNLPPSTGQAQPPQP